MKNLLKSSFALAMLVVFFSACTAGDKGSEQVADSVRIDTTQTPGGTGGSGTSVDSSSVDTAATPGKVTRDTSQKNRSANGAADFKPQKTQ